MTGLRVRYEEWVTRMAARDPNGPQRYDFACFRCNTDDETCCVGCECCWPAGRCHTEGGTP